jgi:ribosomal RNA-processing protein 7
MVKPPREVAGFFALPVILRSAIAASPDAEHYIYLKPHDPKIADEEAHKSLFLANTPATTTSEHLKELFATQLSAGRVEKVHFSEDNGGRSSVATTSNRKRKRMTAEEIKAGLDRFQLPTVYERTMYRTGDTAIVVFVDRPSMEASLKAVRKAIKTSQEIVWGEGLEDKLPSLGLKRYEQAYQFRYPSRRELLRCIDGYMTAYAQMEEARAQENARKRQMPDDDGFVTVMRGSKGGVRTEEAKDLAEKQKDKDKSRSVEDFYRFQMREKRKEEQQKLLRDFEGDKQRVAEMRKRRKG